MAEYGATLVVQALCIGTARPIASGKMSAIHKAPVAGKVMLTRLGIAGDEQADRRYHGGPDMAVHCFPADHHQFWRERLGGHPLLDEPGCFGTNIAVAAHDEQDVCLGDRWQLGGALLEVCQPRKPCATIEEHFGRTGMVKAMVETGRCGWYYRVIEEGEAQAGDTFRLSERPLPAWPVRRVFHLAYGAGGSRTELEELQGLPVLSSYVKERIAKRL